MNSPRRSLRRRLLLASLAVEVLMLALLVANSVRLVQHHLLDQTDARVSAIELAYKTAVAGPLAARDYATLRDILDGWRRAEDVAYIAVTDPAGKVLAASGWDAASTLPEPTKTVEPGAVLHVAFPVDVLGQVYGRVQYGLSTSFLAAARRELFTQSVSIALAELVSSFVLLSILAFWLTRHLEALTVASGRIADGEFATRIHIPAKDEVGALAANFNAMAAAIESHVAELAYEANHDSLTGLHNRRAFEGELRRLLPVGPDRSLFILYLDLDQFKVVNDTCGHAAGDVLLQTLTRALQRHPGFLARLGGDEFGIILDGYHQSEALSCAQAMIEDVRARPFVWEGRTFRIGASVGVVQATDHLDTVVALLIAADTACYAAKERGRNRVEIFAPESTYFRQRRQEFESLPDITAALQEGRFVLYHQRIRSLRPGTADHAEVLVRMLDRGGALIPPARFIPAAERYNMMGFIDRWVIEATLSHMERMAALGRPMPWHHLAINLSGATLADEDLPGFLQNCLAMHPVDPRQLCFEITESSAIASVEPALAFIRWARSVGAHVALDDFGSGLSSFGYLKRFRVDYLKIDGQFIQHLDQDATDKAVVEAMVRLAGAHGLKTIAEFVATPGLLAEVERLGIDFAQGYGVHEPSPLAEA
ncbi:MAG: EAL domain-containing protein [Rhodocyclaceae bacterium]|nr:EAL domain-containing protein [Rhodocyclaceae bacterium]